MQQALIPKNQANKSNPYITDKPVGKTDIFVGRDETLNVVAQFLSGGSQNAMFIYGQRRIGKTSVLQAIAKKSGSDQRYHPIYIDLNGKASLPLAQVLAEIGFHLSQLVDLPPQAPWGEEAPRAFKEDFLPAILRQLGPEITLVFLFDEFDSVEILSGGQAGQALYPYLQEILALNHPQLRFVFAIGRNPEAFASETLVRYKGYEMHPVSHLSLEETAQLVSLSEYNGTLHWPYQAMIEVQTLSGGHPLMTQQLCSTVWDQVYKTRAGERPEVQPEDVTMALPVALKDITAAMEWVWDGLSPAQQVIVSILADNNDNKTVSRKVLEKQLKSQGIRVIITELQQAPAVLAQWGLIEMSGDGYRFPVELQRRWFAENKPWSLVQQQLDHIQPLAHNLFLQARELYDHGNFEQAIPLFQKAIRLNPNHLEANLLLSQTLLAQGELKPACALLEGLHQYYPEQARPRLVQALLLLAGSLYSDDEQLTLYEDVLQLEPTNPEAIAQRRRLWEKRGDDARRGGDLEGALYAYDQAALFDVKEAPKAESSEQPPNSLHRKTGQIRSELSRQEFANKLHQIERLTQAEFYQEAYQLAQELATSFPDEQDRLPNMAGLKAKAEVDRLYQKALDEALKGNRIPAQELLTRVITLEPGYREATNYLHQLASGTDMGFIQSQIKQERATWAARYTQLQDSLQPAPVAHSTPQPAISAPPTRKPTRRRQSRRQRTWLLIGGGVTLVVLLGLCFITLATSTAIGAFTLGMAPTPTVTVTPTATLLRPTPKSITPLPTFTATPDETTIAAFNALSEGGDLSLATNTPTPTNTPPPTDTPTQTSTPLPTFTFTPPPAATNTPVPPPTDTPIVVVVNEDTSPIPTPTNTPNAPDKGAVYGGVLELTSYDLTRLPRNGGEQMTMVTDWKLIGDTDKELAVSVQMLTEISGLMLPSYGQQDFLLRNSSRTTTEAWSVGTTVKNLQYKVTLSDGAPDGTYKLAIVVYDKGSPSFDRLPVTPGNGLNRLGEEILIITEFNIPN